MSETTVTKDSQLAGFIHYTTEGWLFPKRSRDDMVPRARITAFYVTDTAKNQLEVSFAFCSPEDAKIGVFNKAEGRFRASNRFFGFNGEALGRVRLSIYPERSIYDTILDFLEALRDGCYLAVSEGARGEFRACVADINPASMPDSSAMLVSYKGEIKLPNWLAENATIKFDTLVAQTEPAEAIHG